MTLPFDFSTSLWLTSVPVWEWEPVPEPDPAGPTGPACEGEAPAGASAEGPASFDALPGTPTSSAGSERPGYRLTFKGYEIAGQVFWYPADSPLSRPWVAHAGADHRPHRHDEREPLPLPPADAGATDALPSADEDDGTP